MAEAKNVNPVLRQVLELGPTLVFFVIYLWIKDRDFVIGGTTYSGFIVAALVFIPILLASIAALWWLTGKLSRMQIFVALTVIFFGGLTAWFNDSTFFKLKTTIVYGTFATLLGIGLLRGQSWLQVVLGEALPMRHEGWLILTRRLMGMFAALAVANEIIWRTQSDEVWVTLETFAMPIALVVFFLAQARLLETYALPEDKSGN